MHNYLFLFRLRKSGIISSIVHFHKVCTGLSDNAHLHMFAEIHSHDGAHYGSQERDWLALSDNLGTLFFSSYFSFRCKTMILIANV